MPGVADAERNRNGYLHDAEATKDSGQLDPARGMAKSTNTP